MKRCSNSLTIAINNLSYQKLVTLTELISEAKIPDIKYYFNISGELNKETIKCIKMFTLY